MPYTRHLTSLLLSLHKPIIYLYPTEEQIINVQLENEDSLTCVYPEYDNGWTVLAKPNGDLLDMRTNRYQYSLYYESASAYEMTDTGFVVKSEDTISFLEEKLEILGLSEREANEFIIYWLPQMEANPYNLITFQTQCYEDAAKLHITPMPDSVIRIFMVWQRLDTPICITPQELTAPTRTGFTVVEWGGAELS